MGYEIVYVEGIEDDFADIRLQEAEILSVRERLESIAGLPKPLLHTERVINTPLRKIPYKNYRIFLSIDESMGVIYVLAIRHHNRCYKPKELREILTLLDKIDNSSYPKKP